MVNENLKSFLVEQPGKQFVTDLTHRVYPWSVKISDKYINYRIFEEVSIREDATSTIRLGLDYRPNYRFDCVFFIEPGYRSLNQRQVYTVGVKLKDSKVNLMDDDKMEHYIGYTDFFFIGVPSDLIPDAINRAYENEDGLIGVFSVDDGKIQMMPQKQEPTVEHERDLLQQIMYSRMFLEEFKDGGKVIRIDDVEVSHAPLKEDIERGITPAETSAIEEMQAPGAAFISEMDNHPAEPAKNASEGFSGGQAERTEENLEAEKAAAREKEQMRREKHDAKVAVLQKEVKAMNEEVAPVIVSILNGLTLGDQRVYHAIRRHGGIQAQSIAEVLPYQDGIKKPSIATIKRSISALTKAGLIERKGSKKTGQYIVKDVDCAPNSCQTLYGRNEYKVQRTK